VSNHAARDLGRFFQVVLGAGALLIEDELLGRASAQQEEQSPVQFALADIDAVFLGEQLRGAQGTAADRKSVV
jgi:hypothetical protein